MESTPGLPGLELSPALPAMHLAAPLFRVGVIVNDLQDKGQLLDQAVHRLIPTALERKQGILITQILPNTYTVEVNESVLCGVIQEKRISPEMP